MNKRRPKQRITKRIVGALPVGVTVWDTDVLGFGVRCQQKGKSYVLKAWIKSTGSQRWLTIGRHGSPWTPDTARREASRLLGEYAAGRDPGAQRDRAKADLTVSELCDRYLKEGCDTKKPSTIKTDTSRIERHIKPLLGKKKLQTVTQSDVKRLQRDVADGKTARNVKTNRKRGRSIVTGGKGAAAKTVILLAAIFEFAKAESLVASNPARGVKKHTDQQRDRKLDPLEMKSLGTALVTAEAAGGHPSAIAAVRLLALTGARRGEILGLKWQHVDFGSSCLLLPDSKTGKKAILLGAPALQLLAELYESRTEGNDYVLPGKKECEHFVGLQKAWERIRARAGLDDVRLHDLRHNFASVAAGGGSSLVLIGALLGHKDQKTTQRYVHLTDGPVKTAADRTSNEVAAALSGTKPGEVVKLRQNR